MKKKDLIYYVLIIIFAISITSKILPSNTLISIKNGINIIENGINFNGNYCKFQELNNLNVGWLFDVIINT